MTKSPRPPRLPPGVAFLPVLLVATACASTQPGAARPSDVALASGEGVDASTLLVRRGDEHAQAGRSLPAEQYYEAALARGARPDEVVPRLVGACLAGGRLRRALAIVSAERRRVPSDPHLAALEDSLRLALAEAP